MATTGVESILLLHAGETPWQYSRSPGELPGPWGDTTEEAIAAYEADTEDKVREHWLRDGVLWVITARAEAEADDAEVR